LPERQRKIRASEWLTEGRYRKGATILEQSAAMSSFNAVLTLLWVDEDIEEEDNYW